VSRTNGELMAARAELGPELTAAKAVDIPLETMAESLEDLVPRTAPDSAAAFKADLVFLAATGRGVPDTMGAAGPAQYVIALNSVIRSFHKATGQPDGVLDIGLHAFFSAAGLAVCCDPKIRFDRLSGRWFIGAMGAGGRQVQLAVSDGGVLTRDSRWTFFGFQQDQVPPAGDPSCAVDYTRMSVDAHAVYFVFGILNSTLTARCPSNPTGSTAFVVRKSSVLGAGPLVATAFRGAGYFQVPVDQFDASSTVGYITTLFHPTQSGSFYRVVDPGGTPTLSAEVPYSGVPNPGARSFIKPVRHRGSLAETGVPGNDAGRMFLGNGTSHSVPLRHGRLWVGDLWGVDHMGGFRQLGSGSTATRNGLSFVELRDVEGGAPAVVQAGVLFAPSAANDFDQRNYWIPALMVNGQGHLVVAGSAAGTHEYINAAFAGRLATDPPGTLRAPVLFTRADAPYNVQTPAGGTYRWGDYSNASLDPTDDMTIWTVQQAAVGGDVWGIVVARIRAPGPPPGVSASPAMLTQATPSSRIIVTGHPVDGEGFFDPGPGFDGRLRVSIDGGVGVRQVSDVSPTSLTLDVSTTCAANGPHAITIANPDGQNVTIPGFLTTSISPAPVRTAPDAPVLSGSAAGNKVSLAWGSAPTGCEATTFVVEAGSAPGASNLHVGHMGSTRTFAATVPNGVYYIRVRGINDLGSSPPSAELVLYVGVTPVPGAPSGLVATVTGQTVSLSWQPPTSGGPVQQYLIEAGTAPGQTGIGTFPVSGTAFQTAGVPPGAYFVRVRAQNAGGAGAPSNEVIVSVGSQLPGAPANLTASVAPGGRVTLRWLAPAAGGPVAGYRLEAGAGPGLANLAVVTLAASPTSFVADGVPAGTYFVRVAAVGVSGTGVPSNEVVVIVP
jgi:hypothetical protein